MNPRTLVGAAFLVSLVASGWSLSLSGIGPLGWTGSGFFPCELCWYQRILMYPIPVILAVGLALRDERAALYAMPLALAGLLVAAYHILLQADPSLEAGQCFVGSCTIVERVFGLAIPKLSLIAFALVSALSIGALVMRAREGPDHSPPTEAQRDRR